MRIISRGTLKLFWKKHNDSEQQLKSWYKDVSKMVWNNPNELKIDFKNASIINSKRVVFNIKGNDYRLVADIEYKFKLVFVVWIGTHSEYDKLNIEKINYAKTN